MKYNGRIRPFKNDDMQVMLKKLKCIVKNKPFFVVESLLAIDIPLFCFRFSPTANDIPQINRINLTQLTFFIFVPFVPTE